MPAGQVGTIQEPYAGLERAPAHGAVYRRLGPRPSASAFATRHRDGVARHPEGEDAELAPALAVHLGHTCF